LARRFDNISGNFWLKRQVEIIKRELGGEEQLPQTQIEAQAEGRVGCGKP